MSVPLPLNIGNLQKSPIAPSKVSPSPTSLKLNLDFSAGGTISYSVDIGQLIQLQKIDQLNTLFIDNTLNGAALSVSILSSGQNLTVQPNSQGFYPVLFGQTGAIVFTMTGGTTVSGVNLINVETPYLVWGASTSISGLNFNGSGYALMTDPTLIALMNTVIAAGVMSTRDQGLDAIIAAGALTTKDAGLDAIIAGGKLAVSDAALDSIVSGGVAAVQTIGNSYANIKTATTTVVKAAAGTLRKIVINTPIASATIAIYDHNGSGGATIGLITLPSVITGETPVSVPYDLSFTTALTIVTSDVVDITVVFN